jgi:hypothetical protein
LKKRYQKTFANWAPGGETSTVQMSKSFFASFFSKKEALAFFILNAPPNHAALRVRRERKI